MERRVSLGVKLVAVLLVLVGLFMLAAGKWDAALLLFLQAFLTWMVERAREQGFRLGWLRGRLAFWSSMAEAQRRGLSPAEWIIGEAERDGATVTIERVEPEDD